MGGKSTERIGGKKKDYRSTSKFSIGSLEGLQKREESQVCCQDLNSRKRGDA